MKREKKRELTRISIAEMCSKIRESRNITKYTCRLYKNIGASRLIEIHRKFIEIRRTHYNYVRRGHYSSHVAVLSAIHRDSFAHFAMLMTTGWHLAGIWKYAKACIPPIDEYVDHVLGTVIFNSIPSERSVPLFVIQQRTGSRARILRMCLRDRLDRSTRSRD